MSIYPPLKPGDTVTNAELCDIFQCSGQGGMRRSLRTNSLVLVSNPFKAAYGDVWRGVVFHYTGMGLTGDQSLEFAQNRTLNELPTNGVKAFLFEVFEPKCYTFIGEVMLADQPYQTEQEDMNGDLRKVWIFPLALASGEEPLRPAEQTLKRVEEEATRKAQRLSDEEVKRRAQRVKGQPATRQVTSTVFERDPYVVAHAKRRANGTCELCEQPAPFTSKDGEPYLETHHILWLSRGGEDTVENTVALCPNCHRRMHALDLKADRERLMQVALGSAE